MSRALESRWKRIKDQVTLTDLLIDVTGKILMALGVGAWLAQTLAPHAGTLIIAGLALSLTVKAKYWKRFWA